MNAPLDPARLHAEGEELFKLEPGGHVSCHVERGDDESVHLRGRFEARLSAECGRCLMPFLWPMGQELDLFYLPHRAGVEQEEEEEVQLSDHDVVVSYYRDNHLDLGEAIREQIILGLPAKCVCRAECRGLCPTCGGNRNDVPCDCPAPTSLDPRWAALGKLAGGGST